MSLVKTHTNNRSHFTQTPTLLRPNGICLYFTATPSEPFPAIEECKHDSERNLTEEGCSLLLSSYTTNVTCSASYYFPSISLFFQHKSVRVQDAIYWESNNTDGTKNMSVMAAVTASDDPYMCVATDIPGTPGLEKTSAIYIFAPLGEVTTGYPSTFSVTEKNSVHNEHIISKYSVVALLWMYHMYIVIA